MILKPLAHSSRRRGARSQLSPTTVSQTLMALPSPAARELVPVHGSSKNVEAGPVNRTSPATTERVSPTCTMTHAPAARPSEASVAHQRKRRKLRQDADATSPREEKARTTPSSKTNKSPVCVQPPALDEGRSTHVVEASALPHDVVSRVSRTGGIEVLKELRETLFRLRAHSGRGLQDPSPKTATLCNRGPLDTSRSFQVAHTLSLLRVELEVTEVGEQLCRFCRRIALSAFLIISKSSISQCTC